MIEIRQIEQNGPIQEIQPKKKEPIKKSKVILRVLIVMLWAVFLTLLFFQEARDFTWFHFDKFFGPEVHRLVAIPVEDNTIIN